MQPSSKHVIHKLWICGGTSCFLNNNMANFHIFTEGEREGMGRVLFLVDCFKFYIKSMDTNTPRPSGSPRPRVIKI